MMKLFPALLAILLLSACTSSDKGAYRITSVLPSPALPGGVVTVFGTLPEEPIVELAGAKVIATKVSGGVSFTVPEWMSAGVQVLSIDSGGPGLTNVVQIKPRLDSAAFEGRTLRIRGAGWPSDIDPATSVQVILGNDVLNPEITTGELKVELAENASYGSFPVKVRVNDQTSASLNVAREAGTVTGSVVLPASTNPEEKARRTLKQSFQASRAIIVYGTAKAPNEGLLSISEIELFGVIKLEYETHYFAQLAFDLLEQQGARLEWDQVIEADGAEITISSAQPQGSQWFHPLAGMEAAWDVTKGNGVVVAVLDTGVELNHPDLKANLLSGYDFVDPGSEPFDLAGHGTHVAGLVAANGLVKGSAPEASILPVRVLEGLSGGSAFTVAQGILWAAGLLEEPTNPTPAQVINMSLGTNSFTGLIADAVIKAQAEGIIIVAATGNAGGPVAYPAALPGVIAVTALAGPELAYQPFYANRGVGTWITAFGGDTTQDQNKDNVPDGVLSTDLDGYSLRMGTSMASPQVAGLAALALARGVEPRLVRDTLARSAGELGLMGLDPLFGYGLASGRAVTTRSPSTYIVALNPYNEVVGWTVLQSDLTFTLSNLEPDVSAKLVALSDENGNSVLGESGEFASNVQTLVPESAGTISISPLTLNPSDGTQRVTLEATP